jgi:dipeptidyl aminopeptidase/acylaminoacyl peptidase
MNFTDIKQSRITLFRTLFLVFFILPLVTCPVSGQVVQKRKLTTDDYKLWGYLKPDENSPNGEWINYAMQYENGADTLYVSNIYKSVHYIFPAAAKSIFTRDNLFICLDKVGLHILDPKTGKKEIIPGINNYSYSAAANLLIANIKEADLTNTLLIKTPLGDKKIAFKNTSDFALAPDGLKLIYSTSEQGKNAVFLTNLFAVNTSICIAENQTSVFGSLIWQKESKAVTFFSKSSTGSAEALHFYTLKNHKLFSFNPDNYSDQTQKTSIVDAPLFPVTISNDLKSVFFAMRKNNSSALSAQDSKVEIWNTNDKWVYTQEKQFGRFESTPKLVLWEPEKGTITRITTEELSAGMLTADLHHAVLSDPKQYEPQFDFEGPRDYYIMNLTTGKKELFLKRLSASFSGMYSSSEGKYISYFKNKDWFVYDVKRKIHTNVTEKLGVPFYGKVHVLESEQPFGNPGWSKGDKEILLYDEFDIWAVKPDGSSSKRLTHGREAKIKYRLSNELPRNKRLLYGSPLNGTYNLNHELYLNAVGDDGKTGYWRWNKNTKEKPLFYGDAFFDKFSYNTKSNTFFCMEQRFDLPPRIIMKASSGENKTIIESNPQQKKFNWGNSRLVRFQNSKKQDLKGVLYYPADYDPQKKYPMIVFIYEIQSHTLHHYSNPTLHNEPGFNPAVFTAEGYLVFKPDIIHENENVGPSALDCVSSGTNKIIEQGIADPDKIALMGHSFGGYETSFIINHTNLFATAVASGAIVDLTSRFLTFGANMRRPDMWRFTSGGWRMGSKTPLSHRSDFDRNSPLESVTNLNIPLLLWCGKEDTQVSPNQSMEYYLALRRLGKKCIFLQYPGEDHTLLNPVNQEDLCRRLLQWFDYYLKENKNTDWIAKGTS